MTIDAMQGKFTEHNDGECILVGGGTILTFRVADGATAEIDYYSGYENTATIEVYEAL